MAGKKVNFQEKLFEMDGAVRERTSVHSTVVSTCSPSLNFIWGNTWGLPRGHSAILYGPPKGGKTEIFYMMVAQLHKDYPNAFALKFDTEFRDQAQLDEKRAAMHGIDLRRYVAIESNHPARVYDQLNGKVRAMVDDGMDLGLVGIDSVSGMQGRRAVLGAGGGDGDDGGKKKGGVMAQQIGDVAATNKEGLKQILEFQRGARFALLMTAHVAVELDPLEQKRGNKFKMGASVGVQHHAEYFCFVERDRRAAARKDLQGNEFILPSMRDMNPNGKGEQVAHKVVVTMKDASFGPKGRSAEFTLHDSLGVINQWEEVYVLGRRRGIVLKPNQKTYEVPGFPAVVGEENFVEAFKRNPEMQAHILKELKRQDADGISKAYDAEDAAVYASPEVPEEEDGGEM